jgi:hypothetical protein
MTTDAASSLVAREVMEDGLALIYIDRYVLRTYEYAPEQTLACSHLVHEVTSPQAFEGL